MPKILDRLVNQLQNKGINKSGAYAIATSKLQKSGNLKKPTCFNLYSPVLGSFTNSKVPGPTLFGSNVAIFITFVRLF